MTQRLALAATATVAPVGKAIAATTIAARAIGATLIGATLMGSIAAAAPAVAEGRPDTRRMTCAEANAFVQRQGAVVMTTGRHTFRRFVAHRGYCDRWEIVWPETAPTRDNPQCVIRGVCTDPPFPIDLF